MGTAIVCGLLVALFVGLCAWQERRAAARQPQPPRIAWNAYAKELWERDGFYPHEDDNGNVRWYRAPRHAVVNGCPSTD